MSSLSPFDPLVRLRSLHLVANISQFICQVEHIGVVEGHVVPISSKDYHMVLEHDACVAVSRRWSLALHMADHRFASATQHGRTILIPVCVAHCLSLTHLMIVSVEITRIVILNQEGALHVIARGRV